MKRERGREGNRGKKKKKRFFFKEMFPFAALGDNYENLVQKQRLKFSSFHICNVCVTPENLRQSRPSWTTTFIYFGSLSKPLVKDKQRAWMRENTRARLPERRGASSRFDSAKAGDGISTTQNVLTPSRRGTANVLGSYCLSLGGILAILISCKRFSFEISGTVKAFRPGSLMANR